MPISFPSGLDAFTNPSAGQYLNSPDHATQHANANDAIEALEALAVGPIWRNVKAHGAAGDGVADDTAEIQEAITAVTALGGGTVFFPGGTYRVSGLTIGDGITLRGVNPQASILISTGDGVTLVTSTATAPAWAYAVTIKDLGLHSNSAANTNVVGLQLNRTQFSMVDNVFAQDLTWIVKENDCEAVTLSRIKTVTVDKGVYFYKAVNCVLTDSSFFGDATGTTGVEIDSDSDGVELSTVNLDHCGFKMSNSMGGSRYPLSTILTNVQVGGYSGDGFYLDAGSGIQLNNCLTTTNDGFGYRIRTTNGVFLSNCRSVNNLKAGVFAEQGNFRWLGGEVVANSRTSSNTWNGIDVAANSSNWCILGASIGAYGDYSNTQAFGIGVGAGCDNFVVAGNSFGTNVSGDYTSGAVGAGAHIDFIKHRQSEGTAPPAAGYHNIGDIHWNSEPASTEPVGWVCTVAGAPGTWNAFGTIA